MPLVRAAGIGTGRRNPIAHGVVIDALLDFPNGTIRDSFHAMSGDELEYFGLFCFDTEADDHDFRWVVSVNNSNSGDDALEMRSGIALTEVNLALAFHYTSGPIKKYTGKFDEDVKTLVNEKLFEFQPYFNLEFDRCAAFKAKKLTEEQAHHIVCLAIEKEIIAGRIAFEFLDAWRHPDWDYLKPRTLWSLFCLFSWSLNRLTAPILIERTIALHEFFDKLAKFNSKPTKWVQSTFV